MDSVGLFEVGRSIQVLEGGWGFNKTIIISSLAVSDGLQGCCVLSSVVLTTQNCVQLVVN